MKLSPLPNLKSKQAVAASQVFIYIMAVIIFAIVVLIGYRSITGFLEKGEEVSFAAFKTDLERSVRNIASDFGSVRVHDAQEPLRVGDASEVCFVDLDRNHPNPAVCDSESPEFRPLLCTVLEDSQGWEVGAENVFLFPATQGGGVSVFRITTDTNGNLIEDGQDEGWLCLPVLDGRVDVRLEGRGDHAFISPLN